MKAVWLTAVVAMSLLTIVPAVAQAEALDSSADTAFSHICWFVEIETKEQKVSIVTGGGPVASVTVSGQNVCI